MLTKRILSNSVLMIRPSNFGFNAETSHSNTFQNKSIENDEKLIRNLATNEFDEFVDTLRSNDINVITYDDTKNDIKPDAVFPNNWFVTLPGKKFITFPMNSPLRRKERRLDIISDFEKEGYQIIRDLEKYENEDKFLEGTGSMVLDHLEKIVYAAISQRTDREVLDHFCSITGYSPITFKAYGPKNELIYHTNVMMAIGDKVAIIGTDTIDADDKERVLNQLKKTKKVIEISNQQVYKSFLGNCLFVLDKESNEKIIMSQRAFNSLSDSQRDIINSEKLTIIKSKLPTIEDIGGGGARCMLAEIFT